mgnify:CR=1 FL=1
MQPPSPNPGQTAPGIPTFSAVTVLAKFRVIDAVDDADAEARAVGAAGHLGELEAFAPDELVERARAGLAGLVVDGGGADVREAALDGGGRQRRARGVERRDAGGRHAGLEVAEVEVAERVRRAARADLDDARAVPPEARAVVELRGDDRVAPVRGRRGFSGRFENLSEQLAQFSPKAPSPAKSLFSRTLPKTSPLSTPGTSQEAHPPTPPLTPPLTPPEGTQTKPQVLVGRWLPPYGQEAPL